MDKDTFYSVLTQMKYSETGPRLRLYPTCGRQSQLLRCWLKHQNKAKGVTSIPHDNKILFA